MFFAAKAAAERQARKREQKQREAGRRKERERIRRALGERREPIAMEELFRILDGEGEAVKGCRQVF